jgi:hypothetical protein
MKQDLVAAAQKFLSGSNLYMIARQ